MATFTRPDMLVTTDWVAQHGSDQGIRLIEVDVDIEAYEIGHLDGAVGLDWTSQLCDQTRRDVLTKSQFESLCAHHGIDDHTTVVFYGDNNNWFACYALWQFRYFGHPDDRLRVMDGGRTKWILEARPLVKGVPSFPPTMYTAKDPDPSVRATREEVFAALDKDNPNLVDVRSPAEFTGAIIAPPGMNETAQRGGHIPSARNIPWMETVRDDGTFKSYEELKSLFERKGIELDREAITYCRIGERSSHTWFVLKYLVGADQVKNYDGSWTEWGNLVGAPIEKN